MPTRSGKFRSLVPSAMLAAVMLFACDDGTAPAENMTVEEALAMYAGLQEVPAAEPELVAETPDGSVMACPLGGELGVTANTGPVISRVLTPMSCAFSRDGHSFTVTGNPHIEILLTLPTGPSDVFTWRASGGVDWQMDDMSGTCAVDLTGSVDWAAAASSLSGTLCGHDVEGEVILPPV